MRPISTQEFLKVQNCTFKSKAGRYGGTFGDEMSRLAKSGAVKVERPADAPDIKAIIVNKEMVDIRLDSEGRANMNDVHKASGSKISKRPNQFLRTKKARKLVESLDNLTERKSSVSVVEGRSGGTYVHTDILLAYAAWIGRNHFVLTPGEKRPPVTVAFVVLVSQMNHR